MKWGDDLSLAKWQLSTSCPPKNLHESCCYSTSGAASVFFQDENSFQDEHRVLSHGKKLRLWKQKMTSPIRAVGSTLLFSSWWWAHQFTALKACALLHGRGLQANLTPWKPMKQTGSVRQLQCPPGVSANFDRCWVVLKQALEVLIEAARTRDQSAVVYSTSQQASKSMTFRPKAACCY